MRDFCPLLLSFMLASCTALRVEDIPIAEGATFDLLPPSALGRSVSLEQIVEAKYGDKEFSFHCLLEVDPKQLTLVGMTPFNTRAFTLVLKDDEFTMDVAPGAQLPADPSRILADLQLALWPEPRVHGLTVSTVEDQCGFGGLDRFRVFSRGDQRVIQVCYEDAKSDLPWTGTIALSHLEQDYSLTVRTVRAERIEP